MTPGQKLKVNGVGFKYNQFMDSHQWVNNQDIKDMKAKFIVTNILYEDGTRQDFK